MRSAAARLRSAACLVVVLLLVACAPADRPAQAGRVSTGETETGTLRGELTVYAAASLHAAFDELARRFAARHPEVRVRPPTYDGSSSLATQIIEGAPADVFAAADESTMRRVADAGLAGPATLFGANTLTLVVPPGNPAGVDGLDDLAAPGLTVVVCARDVPCGAASAALLRQAGVAPEVDSFEQNVAAVLTKVAGGEADAGLVYVTDARTAPVDRIRVEGAESIVNRYPIVALTHAQDPLVADAFVRFVRSPAGREVLRELGFGEP
ncbi:MAG: molybdate ABC transporter substrate-binding protein [Microbacterium sp.]|nr:MAG: molybdate ABC transporter substrate-binding protein [Microbacterium sp.]